jgi:hypothetical protein
MKTKSAIEPLGRRDSALAKLMSAVRGDKER